jgi:hypothetical protein
MEKDLRFPMAGLPITNEFIPFSCDCEPEERGNLKSSFALLETRLPRFTPRNGKLWEAFA